MADHQNPAVTRNVANNKIEIDFAGNVNASIFLRNLPYNKIYTELLKERQYNVLLLDGALLQLQYTVENQAIIKHRLAFFPSPFLNEFQNDPDLYEEELLFVDITQRNVVVTPVRLDYDSTISFDGDDDRFFHPESHMSIGQYKNCRIPATSAISPSRFFEFILCSFYNSAFREIRSKLPAHSILHPKVIVAEHEQAIHMGVRCRV